MKKKPFQEQLSKFSLLGELPKIETGLEEAWKNLKKCTEPFEVRDIIKQQQETINRQQAEIERLKNTIISLSDYLDILGIDKTDTSIVRTATELNAQIRVDVKSEAIKEFVARLIIVNETTAKYCEANEKVVRVTDIEDLVKEMVGDE